MSWVLQTAKLTPGFMIGGIAKNFGSSVQLGSGKHFVIEGDEYILLVKDDVPAGRYPVWIGMYDPDTFARLPLSVNGEPQPHNALQIGWLEILPQ